MKMKIAIMLLAGSLAIPMNASVAATPKPVTTKSPAPILNPITIKKNLADLVKKSRSNWKEQASYDFITNGTFEFVSSDNDKTVNYDIYNGEIKITTRIPGQTAETYGKWRPVAYIFTPEYIYNPVTSIVKNEYMPKLGISRIDWVRNDGGYANYPADFELNILGFERDIHNYKKFLDLPVTYLEDAFINGTKFSYDAKKREYIIVGRTETFVKNYGNSLGQTNEQLLNEKPAKTTGKIKSTSTVKFNTDGSLASLHIDQVGGAGGTFNIRKVGPSQSLIDNRYIFDWSTRKMVV